jgi:signal transduction histidine kinase
VEAAERIARDGKDAGDVVGRVRSLFKRAPIQELPLNLNDVIRDVLRVLKADVARREAPVSLLLDPGLPLVRGDRVQLQQLIMNLVVNALDAVEPVTTREKQVTVRSERRSDAKGMIEVTDNGIGLEDVEAVFDPFFTTKPNGMGMGLAICRTIAAAHKWSLAAANNADWGATFTLSIPLALPFETARAEQSKPYQNGAHE